MTSAEIPIIRQVNQKIGRSEFNSAKEIVSWMGAMQAQDFSMAKWAVGCRISDPSDEKIEASFNKGEILRSHLMRPTWHFVAREDIYWMLELTARQIRTATRSRHHSLEITKPILSKSSRILEKALSGGLSLAREELVKLYDKAKIRTDDNRLSHLLLCAELDGLVCSGPVKGGKLTYALLAERVPEKKKLAREEALAELAKRYFTSHGPATLQDFIWWSGLTARDARHAAESVKSGFISERKGSVEYLFPEFTRVLNASPSLYLLPAYDEFLISYKDRSASLSQVHNRKTISNNGIFRPVIVVNGQVGGTWKKIREKRKLIIQADFFKPPSGSVWHHLKKMAHRYGQFCGMDVILSDGNNLQNE